MPVPKASSKLTIAAEELIKAACSEVEDTSLAIGKETVESLEKLLIGSSSIENSLGSLKSSMDSKLNTLNQSILNLKEAVVAAIGLQVAAIGLQSKDQKLQWAISNAGMNAFMFYQKHESHYYRQDTTNSTDLVKTILLSFRKGCGLNITNRSKKQWVGNNHGEEGEKKFRDALSNQLHELLGHKPRISLENNVYAIYYS